MAKANRKGTKENPITQEDLAALHDAIRCVCNVKVLDTGFDYPELESVLISKSMMSLSVYYQIIGRVMRPHKYPDGSIKEGWVVDLAGNIRMFGKIETMKIQQDERGLYIITNNGRQLTNVPFTKDVPLCA